MADGAPPKPADDIKKPEGQTAPPQKAVPAADAGGAAAPATEAQKTIIATFTRYAALPGVVTGEACARKTPGAKTEPAQPAEEKREPEKKKPLKIKLFEKGVDAAGFGEILKAWRSPNNRFRNVMKSIGSKAADMVAGRIVSMTFRLIAITWVAGIIGGVSTFGGLALLALATGAASGIYSYGKDYLHDRFIGPKEKRKDVKIIDRARAKSAGISFLSGTFNGALGAWLAKTGILQNLFGMAKDFITSGGGLLSEGFNNSAAKIVAAPLNVPPLAAAFSLAAPQVDVLPYPELAYAPQAIPSAVQPQPGFRRY